MINAKELKKLAATCRKAGISHFKSSEFEFTLTDSLPSPRSTKKQDKFVETAPEFSTDSLTEDALLFWSAGSGDSAGESQ